MIDVFELQSLPQHCDVSFHIAEVTKYDEAELAKIAVNLMAYENEKQYVNPKTKMCVYLFVRHNLRTTKAFLFGQGKDPGPEAIQSQVREALAKPPKRMFTMKSSVVVGV